MLSYPIGSWNASFRFSTCVGPMNRWPSGGGGKAPINRTHSRRFARFGDARQSRSVWSACVFSAAFPRQAAIREPGRFIEERKPGTQEGSEEQLPHSTPTTVQLSLHLLHLFPLAGLGRLEHRVGDV